MDLKLGLLIAVIPALGLSFLDSTEEQRCESSGYPGPGYELRIIDPETGAEQPTGTPGEMLLRG